MTLSLYNNLKQANKILLIRYKEAIRIKDSVNVETRGRSIRARVRSINYCDTNNFFQLKPSIDLRIFLRTTKGIERAGKNLISDY